MDLENKISDSPKIWAILPAAGIGKRMGCGFPKQYIELEGKTVLEHSLERIVDCTRISGVVLGLARDDQYWPELNLNHEKLIDTYIGGQERIHTVKLGLDLLSANAGVGDWVIVHDAVRPCVPKMDIENLIAEGSQSTSGAILACPVIDTIKKVNAKDNTIQKTLNRDELMLSLTPQIFPIALLKNAIDRAISNNQLSTDEAQAVENLGEQPVIVQGQRSNIKITTAEDLQLARVFLQTIC